MSAMALLVPPGHPGQAVALITAGIGNLQIAVGAPDAQLQVGSSSGLLPARMPLRAGGLTHALPAAGRRSPSSRRLTARPSSPALPSRATVRGPASRISQ